MRELELYIHIPFCVRKCAYCDFLSFGADSETKSKYVDQLILEIKDWQDAEAYSVSTVFFGGGTPSILPPGDILRIMEALKKRFSFAEKPEITIECNPGTLDGKKLQAYRTCGINRLSIGLQSASQRELSCLGRIHTWEDFLEGFFGAREAGFENINVDLMSGLPGQSCASWEDTLGRVTALAPEHISAYGLMIEEGTPFYERYGEDAKRQKQGQEGGALPSEEEERRMYHRTKKLLGDAGYRRYEISNYALPGRECRHNCGYWERKEYKGFGLGAASMTENMRYANTADLASYLAGKREEGLRQKLSVEEQIEETMFLGLRMSRGISRREFLQKFGRTIESVYEKTLWQLVEQGLIMESEGDQSCGTREDGRISLTERGIDISNYVLSQFLL
ncbi:MAG: radical SAM family heme chaperone HemW [Eubacteriales bacterium]|nr:radical SAM family heme chaperone HemW [Eubacteriales bacterium]